MFKSNVKITSRKALIRKISLFLTSNFFTIEEFNQLTYREAKKVVKYLAKIQKVKLSKDEINEVIFFLRNTSKPKVTSGILKIFTNIKKHFVITFEKSVNSLVLIIESTINSFLKFLMVLRC